MALHITDPELDALAKQAQKILKAETKTDAVRQALERVVGDEAETVPTSENPRQEKTLEERMKALQDRVKAMGTPNPDFDDKAFLDEMWEI
ncbi:antitoxin VapB [Neorhizobium huautlense]|uniref:Antitoxin VapB n=1 Tax=Neorhizobium huautlense TaxID=67774 RepID=A0ABT9PXE4_9HYPH|nr:type II toxin-antitoxin system VapB family antitoxin [Neorhizobium huautlense]MDP9839097.1 antitoxin VapB [Neorhizobium huautlense]